MLFGSNVYDEPSAPDTDVLTSVSVGYAASPLVILVEPCKDWQPLLIRYYPSL